ncbi:hypothetical protein M072_4525 [Bacteroides fragilis str. DS-208]|nr:hypothetical protein M072_4525 [Bacteroides fragilis str. DS-208]
MTSIFKNPHAVFVGYLAVLLHIVRITGKVYEYHTLVSAFRSSRQNLLKLIDIKEISLRVDINKLNITPTETDTVGRRSKGHRSTDDIITLLNTQCHGSNVKSRSSIANCYRVLCVYIFTESLFKLGNSGATSEVITSQSLDNRLNVVFGNELTTI